MLTAYDVQSYHVRAIRVGAAGYLSKMSDATTIATTIRRIHGGHRGFSARRAPERLPRPGDPHPAGSCSSSCCWRRARRTT